MRRDFAIALLVLFFFFNPSLVEAGPDGLTIRFERLKRDRRQILDELVVPIEQCVQRRDTSHIAFHGCIDWHSSVHGTWALVKYSRLTGSSRYQSLLNKVLRPETVSAEFSYLQRYPDFEMPYGRAWFLRLALEHHETFKSALLIPMGDDVAKSLVEQYRRSPPQPLSREYSNASWALINLYDYGMTRRDRTITGFVEQAVRRHFIPLNSACPIQNEETIWPDFMAVCTTWAYLVAQVAPAAEVDPWVKRFFPLDLDIRPIDKPRSAHHFGMNFSRSWGFWKLYKATKDNRYLRLYLDHFELQYGNPSWWRGDYRMVGHWVAQFGVFALAPVFAE